MVREHNYSHRGHEGRLEQQEEIIDSHTGAAMDKIPHPSPDSYVGDRGTGNHRHDSHQTTTIEASDGGFTDNKAKHRRSSFEDAPNSRSTSAASESRPS